MNRILTDLEYSIKIYFRNKTSMFWSLIFPILLMVIFGFIFGGDSGSYDVYIQDNDRSSLSQDFIDALTGTGALNHKIVSRGENVNLFANENDVGVILIIPEGFEESVMEGKQVGLKVKVDRSKTSSSIVLSIVDGVSRAFSEHITGVERPIYLVPENMVSSKFEFIDFFMPGIIGMTVMTMSLFGTVETNTRYRTNGILKKLATTPLTKAEYISARVIYQLMISFISTAVILLLGIVAFKIVVIPNLYSVVLIIAGTLTFGGIGMVIARFVKDTESAGTAANAISFPMMFLSGTFFPKESMPIFIQKVAAVLPLTYLNDGLRASMIYDDPATAMINTVIITATGVFFIVLGIFITNWTE